MTVTEYEEQFTTLSRFAPDLVVTEGARCRRFQQSLELNIQSWISAFEMIKYAKLVNKAKIVERDVQEFSGRPEQFKKGRFDTGAGSSKPKSADLTTTMEPRRAQSNFKPGGRRSSSPRGVSSARGRGSWRPPVRPTSNGRTGSTGTFMCYKCRGEGHMVRDCPMPWTDACY